MALLFSGTTVTLGKDVNSGDPVTLEQEQRLGGMSFIGLSGFGKTTMLINLLLQDVEQGIGGCFFDTHGDAIQDILARLPSYRIIDGMKRPIEEDVILLNLVDTEHPFGINFYECPNPNDPRQRSLTVNYLRDVIAKFFTKEGDLTSTPLIAQMLRNTTLTMIDNPGMTLAELPLLLKHEDARARLTKQVKHSIVRLFWDDYERMKPSERQGLYASTLNKVEEFLTDDIANYIFGQSQTTVDFRKIMDSKPGKILLIRLDRNLEQLTSLVGSVIISQIAKAAFSREDTPYDDRVQFNLYADEYERFQTPTFADLIAEVRKYKVAPLISFQWLSQRDFDNRSAARSTASLILSRLNADDAEEFKSELHPHPRRDLVWEPLRKPVNITHTTVYWEPPEAEEQWKAAIEEQKRLRNIVEKLPLAILAFFYYTEYLHDLSAVERSITPDMIYSRLLPNVYSMTNPQPGSLEFPRVTNALVPYQPEEIEEFYRITPAVKLYAECYPDIFSTYPIEEIKKYAQGIWERVQPLLNEFKKNRVFAFIPAVFTEREIRKVEEEEQEKYYKDLDEYEFKPWWKFWKRMRRPVVDEYRTKSEDMWATRTKQFQRLKNSCNFGDKDYGFWRIREYPPFLDFLKDEVDRMKPVIAQLETEIAKWETKEAELLTHKKERKEEEYLYHVEEIISFTTSERTGGRGWGESTSTTYQVKKWIKEPGPEEPLSNAKDRIVEILTHLEPYTACIKFKSGSEHTIHIDDKKAPDAESVVKARTQKIVELTRLIYCKKRTDVEQEIAVRQEELTKPLKKQPKGRPEDKRDMRASKLASIQAALSPEDFNRFFNDPLVKEGNNLSRLLDIPEFTADELKKVLDNWRKAGSPSGVSPFAELIKKLVG